MSNLPIITPSPPNISFIAGTGIVTSIGGFILLEKLINPSTNDRKAGWIPGLSENRSINIISAFIAGGLITLHAYFRDREQAYDVAIRDSKSLVEQNELVERDATVEKLNQRIGQLEQLLKQLQNEG